MTTRRGARLLFAVVAVLVGLTAAVVGASRDGSAPRSPAGLSAGRASAGTSPTAQLTLDDDREGSPPATDTSPPIATSSPGGSGTIAPGGAGSSPSKRLPAIPRGAVPILYYHRVEALPPAYDRWPIDRQRRFIAYDVLPTALEAQLDWLMAHGYTTILPRDLTRHWDRGAHLPKRPIILTFDDGFHDWASTVLPMLRARGMVAEFYLTLDAVRSGAITWREVRRLARAGNGIGAHDVHHVQLAGFGASRPPASTAVMWTELMGARRIIAEHVGIAPDSMAYVGGGFDPTLERLVRRAGYTSARSIIRGIVQTVGRRFELRVERIGPKDDVADLLRGQLVAGLPTFVARLHGVSDLAP